MAEAFNEHTKQSIEIISHLTGLLFGRSKLVEDFVAVLNPEGHSILPAERIIMELPKNPNLTNEEKTSINSLILNIGDIKEEINVNSLLYLAISGKYINKKSASVKSIIRDAIGRFERRSGVSEGFAGIQKVVIDDIRIICNRRALISVIAELLHNAWKYRSPDDSTIYVYTISTDEYLEIIIKNNVKTSVDHAALNRVFEEWYRIPQHDNIIGTGGGLWKCLLLIRSQQGELGVRRNEDQTVEFYIKIFNLGVITHE